MDLPSPIAMAYFCVQLDLNTVAGAWRGQLAAPLAAGVVAVVVGVIEEDVRATVGDVSLRMAH